MHTDSSSPAPPHVLKLPAFRLFLMARALSSIAFQGSAVAIGWLIYDKTRNPFDLGLVGLFQFLPMLALTLPAGHVADQFDRRRIALVCQVLEAIALAFMAFGVWSGTIPVWGIFAAVFVVGGGPPTVHTDDEIGAGPGAGVDPARRGDSVGG